MTGSTWVRAAALLVALLPLGGCGYLFGDDGLFRDSSGDYRASQELPVMAVPEGRTAEGLDEIYAIPPITADPSPNSGDKIPRPAPLLSASADQMVRIQRLGEDSWALVAIPPGQLWPQVRSFLSAANVPINRVDARAGIIETSYLELQNEDRPARFRFRVERGVQRGNSELHVLQMFQTSDDQSWPEDSDDVELEAEMLRSVAQFIANSADTAPVSMMAEQSIAATGRVALVEDRGDSFIRLELPFERAWAALARALETSGFEITDRNRSEGRYYVTYTGDSDEKKDSGWFSWFGSDDETHPLSGVPLLLTMSEEPSGSLVIRLAAEGGAAKDQDILSLLQLIKGNIN
jgi:outer membrane protein assembly factor BamC